MVPQRDQCDRASGVDQPGRHDVGVLPRVAERRGSTLGSQGRRGSSPPLRWRLQQPYTEIGEPLGPIPEPAKVREGGDAGVPAVAQREPGTAAFVLHAMARQVAARMSVRAARQAPVLSISSARRHQRPQLMLGQMTSLMAAPRDAPADHPHARRQASTVRPIHSSTASGNRHRVPSR